MPPPTTRPSYLKAAINHPMHRTLLGVLIVLLAICLWRRLWSLAFLLIAAEGLYLFLAPRLSPFQKACDDQNARVEAQKRAATLDQIASRLSTNAKARYDGVQRVCGKFLDTLRAQPSPEALEALWTPRLRTLSEWALRLLVSIDATRADSRDQRALEREIESLEREIAELAEGSATQAAKQQKLALTRSKLERFAKVKDQREAAIVQLEIIEGVLDDLLAKGLSGHDEAAFGAQLELLSGQVDALGDSLSGMARQQSDAYALDSLKALNS